MGAEDLTAEERALARLIHKLMTENNKLHELLLRVGTGEIKDFESFLTIARATLKFP